LIVISLLTFAAATTSHAQMVPRWWRPVRAAGAVGALSYGVPNLRLRIIPPARIADNLGHERARHRELDAGVEPFDRDRIGCRDGV
jgi:hypothetical protein